MQRKAYPKRWRRGGAGPLGPHGETAERLAALYAGTETEALPSELETLLRRLEQVEASQSLSPAL